MRFWGIKSCYLKKKRKTAAAKSGFLTLIYQN